MPLFTALESAPPAWLHDASWNLLRLTGRGLDGHGGSFSVQFLSDGFSVILK